MEIKKNVFYVGVNDKQQDLFEGQYVVPNGMAYNSYVLIDDKIVVMDTVDEAFAEEWLNNLDQVLRGRRPDYLVVQHMEPDHSANIVSFTNKYPSAKIVASAKAFVMMKNFFGVDFSDRQIVVGDGDVLALGKRTLAFFVAPMVHWPEVIVSYESLDKILFSADAFGKFGVMDAQEDWVCEARRYYFGVVGKYGAQVQTLLKKLSTLSLEMICPLHGPILTRNLDYYLGLYDTWSSYEAESEGVMIAYTSVYGNTEEAVNLLAQKLRLYGCDKVIVTDLARSDMSEMVEDAFRYKTIVLATTTYNGGIFPFMREFLHHLIERNFQKRRIAFMENGSWAPMATRLMKGMLEGCKNLQYAEAQVRILSSMTEENKGQIDALAQELANVK